MGFHATSPLTKGHPPSKNRVGGFRRSSPHRARSSSPQPLAKEQFSAQPPANFASGLPCWPSRDPIGEWGGVNIHSAFENAPTLHIDPDGRFCMRRKDLCSIVAEQPRDTWPEEDRQKVDLMERYGCSIPVINCECCEDSNENGRYSWITRTITLCEKRRTIGQYAETRKHELSHAFDHCFGATVPGCHGDAHDSFVCTELRAYHWANGIRDRPSLIRAACGSVMAVCAKGEGPQGRQVRRELCEITAEKLLDKCTSLGVGDPLPKFPVVPSHSSTVNRLRGENVLTTFSSVASLGHDIGRKNERKMKARACW